MIKTKEHRLEGYSIIKILSTELIAIISIDGQQLFSFGRLTKKKREENCTTCRINFCELGDVGKKAWRPITNKGNRMERMCVNCMTSLIVKFSKDKQTRLDAEDMEDVQ